MEVTRLTQNDKIQLFEDKRIRTAWDEEKEAWYFSVIDVVAVLTDQPDYQAARNYWKVNLNCGRNLKPSLAGDHTGSHIG